MHWIVVQVQPQKEDYAAHNLTLSGFRCHSPKIILQKAGKLMSAPMFRGYIFVEIDVADVNRWRSINSHRGVQRILGQSNGHPAKLPANFVEQLIAIGDLHEQPQLESEYEKGQKIVFTSGPLFGISGIVHHSNKERVALLVELLGTHTIVQAPKQNISLSGAASENGCSAAAIK